MNQVRASVRIAGRVQGVFFRQSTCDMALSLEITGWVRNLPDGTVEATFEGSSQDVKNMLYWCRTGPRAAKVEAIDVRWEDPTGEFTSFLIR